MLTATKSTLPMRLVENSKWQHAANKKFNHGESVNLEFRVRPNLAGVTHRHH
ncbi:MAG: hypothetical protein ACPGXK_09465 [Phycisphaerae bacterium]